MKKDRKTEKKYKIIYLDNNGQEVHTILAMADSAENAVKVAEKEYNNMKWEEVFTYSTIEAHEYETEQAVQTTGRLVYKTDVLTALKEKGYTTYRIRKENLITEKSLTAIRRGNPIHWTTIEKICELLDCQPNDFLEFVKDES